ncbi:hypothetical protein AX14_008623 [Amanita brunnescens Koide BX004]|nr:hypothetical protein AX14_008623 [Amanita brunnescens Koide BX004]
MRDDNAATNGVELKEEQAEMQKRLEKLNAERAELRRSLDEERSAREQLENDIKLERLRNDASESRLQLELEFAKRFNDQARENDKVMQDLKDAHCAEWKRVAEEA